MYTLPSILHHSTYIHVPVLCTEVRTLRILCIFLMCLSPARCSLSFIQSHDSHIAHQSLRFAIVLVRAFQRSASASRRRSRWACQIWSKFALRSAGRCVSVWSSAGSGPPVCQSGIKVLPNPERSTGPSPFRRAGHSSPNGRRRARIHGTTRALDGQASTMEVSGRGVEMGAQCKWGYR